MDSNKIVLFVEDDRTMQSIYKAKAASLKIKALLASDPSEAVAILRQQTIDLIVTDLNMPNYDGVDLIKAVRGHPKTKHIPIIVRTYGGNLERVDSAGVMGANEIHDKQSCPPEKLFERIRHFLGASESRSEASP